MILFTDLIPDQPLQDLGCKVSQSVCLSDFNGLGFAMKSGLVQLMFKWHKHPFFLTSLCPFSAAQTPLCLCVLLKHLLAAAWDGLMQPCSSFSLLTPSINRCIY